MSDRGDPTGAPRCKGSVAEKQCPIHSPGIRRRADGPQPTHSVLSDLLSNSTQTHSCSHTGEKMFRAEREFDNDRRYVRKSCNRL